MNPLSTLIPRPGNQETAGESCAIGVVITSFYPGSCTSFAASIFLGALNIAMAGERTELFSGLFGDGFIVGTAGVRDRNSGLRAIRDVVGQLGNPLCEIAFYDTAEQIWRTVYPESAALPFNRFLSDSNLKAARDRLAEESSFIAGVMESARRTLENQQ